MHVAASSVGARLDALDEANRFEHIEMMGEKVGAELEELAEFGRRAVTASKRLNDAQPYWIAESGMERCASCDRRGTCHPATLAWSANSVNDY